MYEEIVLVTNIRGKVFNLCATCQCFRHCFNMYVRNDTENIKLVV